MMSVCKYERIGDKIKSNRINNATQSVLILLVEV